MASTSTESHEERDEQLKPISTYLQEFDELGSMATQPNKPIKKELSFDEEAPKEGQGKLLLKKNYPARKEKDGHKIRKTYSLKYGRKRVCCTTEKIRIIQTQRREPMQSTELLKL